MIFRNSNNGTVSLEKLANVKRSKPLLKKKKNVEAKSYNYSHQILCFVSVLNRIYSVTEKAHNSHPAFAWENPMDGGV